MALRAQKHKYRSKRIINDLLTLQFLSIPPSRYPAALHGLQTDIRPNDITEYGSGAFDEFLAVLGEKIRLKGWERFRGGLDVKGEWLDDKL